MTSENLVTAPRGDNARGGQGDRCVSTRSKSCPSSTRMSISRASSRSRISKRLWQYPERRKGQQRPSARAPPPSASRRTCSTARARCSTRGADALVLDCAHGHSRNIMEAVEEHQGKVSRRCSSSRATSPPPPPRKRLSRRARTASRSASAPAPSAPPASLRASACRRSPPCYERACDRRQIRHPHHRRRRHQVFRRYRQGACRGRQRA